MEIEKLLENMRYCCGDMGYDDECTDHCIDPRDNRENEEEPRFCRQWLIRDAANVIEELQNQLAAVTAERDAAIKDLKKHRKYKCDCCYYNEIQSQYTPCRDCQSPISNYGDDWKWRGKGESNGI